jgi:hypothetical protein
MRLTRPGAKARTIDIATTYGRWRRVPRHAEGPRTRTGTTLGENDDRSTEAGEPVRLPILGARPAAVGGATAVELRMEGGRALLVYVWTEEAGP